jgi:hypothetical protein
MGKPSLSKLTSQRNLWVEQRLMANNACMVILRKGGFQWVQKAIDGCGRRNLDIALLARRDSTREVVMKGFRFCQQE